MIEIIYIFLIGQNKCTNLFHQHRYVDFTMPLTSTNDKNRWTAPEVLIRWQHNAEIFMASRENHHSNTTNIWKHNWSTQERERTTHCGMDEYNLKVSIRHEHSTEFTHLNPFLGHIHTLLHTPQWVWFTEASPDGWYVNCCGQRAQSVLLYLGLMTCSILDGLMIWWSRTMKARVKKIKNSLLLSTGNTGKGKRKFTSCSLFFHPARIMQIHKIKGVRTAGKTRSQNVQNPLETAQGGREECVCVCGNSNALWEFKAVNLL